MATEIFDEELVNNALSKQVSVLFRSVQKVLVRGRSILSDQALRYLATTADNGEGRDVGAERTKTGTRANRSRRAFQECLGTTYLRLAQQVDAKRTVPVFDRTAKELSPHIQFCQSLLMDFNVNAPGWLKEVSPITLICFLMFDTYVDVKLRQDNVCDGLVDFYFSSWEEGIQGVLSDWQDGKRFPFHMEKFKELWVELCGTLYRDGVLGWNEDPPSPANGDLVSVPEKVRNAIEKSFELISHLHALIPVFVHLQDGELDLHMFGWKNCVKDFKLQSKVGEEGNLSYEEFQTDWLKTLQCLSGDDVNNEVLGMVTNYLAIGDIGACFSEEDRDDITLFGYQGEREGQRSVCGRSKKRPRVTFVKDLRLQLEVLGLWKFFWGQSKAIADTICAEAEFN